MTNNHILTKNIGNLRGFSTDSIYLRPPNVADIANNIQKSPDGTIQLRRGFQVQIAKIGGLGMGTFDDPDQDQIQTVTVSTDGFLYNKLTRQIFLYYDGRLKGNISGVTNASPAVVTTAAPHGLVSGVQVRIRDVQGTTSINNHTFTIVVIDPTHFSLTGSDTSLDPVYVANTGYWSLAWTENRYLTFSIYVDPAKIYDPVNQSINCKVIENLAAQVNGNQGTPTPVTTINVLYGHDVQGGRTIQFVNSSGVLQTRQVIGVGPTSITISGTGVVVDDQTYINQIYTYTFGKGFDIPGPIPLSVFLTALTQPGLGVFGLTYAINGLDTGPAAFLALVEPYVITFGTTTTLNYWYWEKVNSTNGVNPPFPGSADVKNQNSQDFENAAMAAFDDVIYITNGYDYPQKYDSQTVYRAGMPKGGRTSEAKSAVPPSLPFVDLEVYQYAITYEQVDNRGHVVEGELSEVDEYTVPAAGANPSATAVTIPNLRLTTDPVTKKVNNWNLNFAKTTASTATVYGPDADGLFYDFVTVAALYTLKIGDTAYYVDRESAIVNGNQGPTHTITVDAGHNLLVGDSVYFFDQITMLDVERTVESTTATTITLNLATVTVLDNDTILSYKQSKVFGNIAIVDTAQTSVNNIQVLAGYKTQLNDFVTFTDSSGNMQRRKVTALPDATHVTIDGVPVSVASGIVLKSETMRATELTLQRTGSHALVSLLNDVLSNNLRINIYRTFKNQTYGTNGKIYLVASIPNDSSISTQVFIDTLPDAQLTVKYDTPDKLPTPPPISKYVRAFGNQLFYAGGEVGFAENSDKVFFSEGNEPEVVPIVSNFFNVPNVDDDITGIGVSGSTLVTTKNHSLWAAAGNFLTGDIEVIQIAPGTNIGCAAHASIACVGSLMYFLHTNGVYTITESQLFPTDAFGNPIPISLAIDAIFRETKFLPETQYAFKRATAVNYTKDNQYLLFLPCENAGSSIRTANSNSIILCYDYQAKNWFQWNNMNAAGGFAVVDDDLYFQERAFSAVEGNTANFYKQRRFYRLIDHADHAGPQFCEWRSSWEDLGQPEVRKKFSKCILLMDRLSELQQYNNPTMTFSSYLNRIPNLQNTIATVTQVDNVRNSSWSVSGWGWNYWSGYQDSFVNINLKQGTVAKSMQVGFTLQGINMDIRLAGYQLEAIPENRMTAVR